MQCLERTSAPSEIRLNQSKTLPALSSQYFPVRTLYLSAHMHLLFSLLLKEALLIDLCQGQSRLDESSMRQLLLALHSRMPSQVLFVHVLFLPIQLVFRLLAAPPDPLDLSPTFHIQILLNPNLLFLLHVDFD